MTNIATPEVVAALANSVRLSLLYEINLAGKARTSDLAKAVGLAPNKVSYHLKKLESAGVITKEAGHEDARQTWWSAVPGGWECDTPELAPGLHAAMSANEQNIRARGERFVTERQARGERIVAAMGDTIFTLSYTEANAFATELSALFEKYTAATSEHAAKTSAAPTAGNPEYRYDFRFSLLPVAEA